MFEMTQEERMRAQGSSIFESDSARVLRIILRLEQKVDKLQKELEYMQLNAS